MFSSFGLPNVNVIVSSTLFFHHSSFAFTGHEDIQGFPRTPTPSCVLPGAPALQQGCNSPLPARIRIPLCEAKKCDCRRRTTSLFTLFLLLKTWFSGKRWQENSGRLICFRRKIKQICTIIEVTSSLCTCLCSKLPYVWLINDNCQFLNRTVSN